MKNRIGIMLAVAITSGIVAMPAQAIDEHQERQLKLLYKMTDRAGSNQKVFIYDGFRDQDVDQFFNDQFKNIQNVMFTNVIVTDKQGRALKDPRTGLMMREDDGC